MRNDLVFSVEVLLRKGVDSREIVLNIATAVHEFFVKNNLFINNHEMAEKIVDDNYAFYRVDLNARGIALIKKGWINYLARFERNRYADPYDTRVLAKYLKKVSEGNSPSGD
ncbi:hypothetical protein ACSV5G_10725 [Agrobacterium cavarae]|uniref:hypothetical protein n=1 Tax=Agrobacterium cavarae TaxID=2528239 RepID=UPI003FD168A9